MGNWTRWVSVIGKLPDDRIILAKKIYSLRDTVDNWSVSFNTLLLKTEDPLDGAAEIFSDIFKIDTSSYSDNDVEIKRLKPVLLNHSKAKVSVFLAEFKKSVSFRVEKDMMVIARPIEEVKHHFVCNKEFFSIISEKVMKDLILREDF